MLNTKITLKKSKIHGMGLFATKPIKKGEVIWKFTHTTLKEVVKRQFEKLPRYKQRLFYQHGKKFISIADILEYINHSCNPTAWWLGDDTLVARRNIKEGEEITYDYSTNDVNPRTLRSMRCNCGSKCCRKIVTYKDCLSSEFQKKYKGHLPSWVIRFIKEQSSRQESKKTLS